MTNEEAIKIGKTRQECLRAQNDGRCKYNLIPNYCNKGCEYNTSDKEYDEFETLAIKALQQKPCEDCVSREAVYDFIRSLPKWCVKSEDRKFDNVGLLYDDVMFGIDKLPSVTPKGKTGWHIIHGVYEDRFWCSCGFIKVMDIKMNKWKYCPVCGASMEDNIDGHS